MLGAPNEEAGALSSTGLSSTPRRLAGRSALDDQASAFFAALLSALSFVLMRMP